MKLIPIGTKGSFTVLCRTEGGQDPWRSKYATQTEHPNRQEPEQHHGSEDVADEIRPLQKQAD